MFFAHFRLKGMSYYRVVFSFFGFMSFLFLGATFANIRHTELIEPNSVVKKHYCAVVTQQPEEKPKSFKVQLMVLDSVGNETFEIVGYLKKDCVNNLPQMGDLILLNSNLQRIKNSNSSPTDFDYAGYMARKGIYYQTYIKSNNYNILQTGYKKNISYYANKIRNKLINTYKKYQFGEQELAVLEALTLGYKADLDEDTKSAFQSSGAMHVLAVSGLHTGIIMLITNMLLQFLNKTRRSKIIKCTIIISIIWIFAAITGFSSSVNRAALMFSIMAIGDATGRYTITYNSIAVSCFILLMIDPYLIFNVGFGLSYLAVISIVSFNPIFKDIENKVKNRVLKYFLGIVLVSIAAQIGTSVLSICTFGQFPIYFLLTNIIVIPVAYLIMMLAIALLVTNAIPIVGYGIFWILNQTLKFMVFSVQWIESLPLSCIKNIVLDNHNAILLYLMTISLVVFFNYKKFKWIKITAFCLLTISILQTLKLFIG